MTTALEEMTLKNEQLRREVDVLKANNDAMKNEITQLQTNDDKQKDEIGQLTTLLNQITADSKDHIQQVNSKSSKIDVMREEIGQLRNENHQLKVSQ